MNEVIQKNFCPTYNSVDQVKKSASSMLDEPIEEVKIAIIIGHDGVNFVSSTVWQVTTKSGIKKLIPFFDTQYPKFLECVAGVAYADEQGQFAILPDSGDNYNTVVVFDDKPYSFEPGKILKIYVKPNGQRFVATGCAVEYQDTGVTRIYKVITDKNTLYGRFGAQGKISQF